MPRLLFEQLGHEHMTNGWFIHGHSSACETVSCWNEQAPLLAPYVHTNKKQARLLALAPGLAQNAGGITRFCHFGLEGVNNSQTTDLSRSDRLRASKQLDHGYISDWHRKRQ